jgi:HD superfamily phosphohydrolase
MRFIKRLRLRSAEALLLARYFMFSQVYFHRIRRIYDIHLKDFLCQWLPGNKFSTDLDAHLSLTDNEIIAAIRELSQQTDHPAASHARRIIKRDHFKLLYEPNSEDIKENPEAAIYIHKEAISKFGTENIRIDHNKKEGGAADFPVLAMDQRINSSLACSSTLRALPTVAIDYVFVEPGILNEAKGWLKKNLRDIIKLKKEE